MYNNYPQTTVPLTEMNYSNPYEASQYAQSFPTNQPMQAMYDSGPSQSSVYSVPAQQQQQQQQYVSYPQYVDQKMQPQQPPSYASVVQSPYPMPVQQQPFQYNNPGKYIFILYE